MSPTDNSDTYVADQESLGSAKPDDGWGALLSGVNAMRVVVLVGGIILHGFYMFITSTVLPSIVAEVGGVAYYAWVSTIFGIGSIAGAMLAPVLLLRLSARRAYQLGLAIFAIGSISCAIATTMAMIIAGRCIQGVAGGLLAAIATSMIPFVFADKLRSRAIALMSSAWGPTSLIGPFVGGVLAQYGTWRAAFWGVLPLLCIGAVLADRVLPAEDPRDDREVTVFSSPQALRLALIAVAALILSVSSVPGNGWFAIVGCATAFVFLAVAIGLDRHARRRVLVQNAFALATPVGLSSFTMMLLVFGVGAGPFVPFVLSFAYGVPAIVAGYTAALSSLAWSIAALFSASAGVPLNRRLVAVAPIVVSLGLAGVGWCLSIGNLVGTAAFWALFGAGVGTAWPHLASRLIGYSSPGERSFAGGFVTTLQILGGTFGAALAGMIANLAGISRSTAPQNIAHGGFLLFASFAVLPLIASLLSARLLRLTCKEECDH
jgi:MFS family permease